MSEQFDPVYGTIPDPPALTPSEQADLIVENIVQALGEPKMVSGDAGSFENPDITQIIAAHKYMSGLDPAIVANPMRAIRFARFRPPGAV